MSSEICEANKEPTPPAEYNRKIALDSMVEMSLWFEGERKLPPNIETIRTMTIQLEKAIVAIDILTSRSRAN